MNTQLKLILIFLFLSNTLFQFANHYTFRNLTVTDGLSDLVVNSIFKDQTGYVWFGTNTTLERFDGISLKHYSFPGEDEKKKRVYTIEGMSDGEIWIGNGLGLWKVEGNSPRQIMKDKINCGVFSLKLNDSGTLFICTEKGLFTYEKDKLVHHLIEENILASSNIVRGVEFGEVSGTAWIATDNGLYFMEKSGDISLCPENGGKQSAYLNITRIAGTVYMGTMDKGIVAYDINDRTFKKFVDIGCNIISSLSSDGKDLLYVGTDGNGVHFISSSKQSVVNSFKHVPGAEQSIRSNSVYSLLVDEEGLIWIGFYQLGVSYTLYQSGLFATYNYNGIFDSKGIPVRTISFDKTGKLIGSRDGLYYVDERLGKMVYLRTPQLRSSMIICSDYADGVHYVGTYGGGMYVFNPQNMKIGEFNTMVDEDLESDHIFCVRTDKNRNLWVGTSNGLYCYSAGKLLYHFTHTNSQLPEGNVYEIFFDSTSKGWICTENGISIFDPSTKTLRNDIFPKGFINKEKIRVVYEDSEKKLYFLPDKGDLFRSDLMMTSFSRLHKSSPLSGKSLMSIIEDNEGWLWITTNNGMFRFDKNQTYRSYNFSDGLPGSIFINCYPIKDNDGVLWFGNSKGLVYLDQKSLNQCLNNKYKMAVSDVFVNGKLSDKPLQRTDENEYLIELESSQKNISLCFSGFTFTDPTNMSYEYRLIGVDEEWRTLSGKSELTYYDLPSGSYSLYLRRSGLADTGVLLRFTIGGKNGIWIIIVVLVIAAFIIGGWEYIRRRRRNIKFKADINEMLKHYPSDKVDSSENAEQENIDFKKSSDSKYRTNKISPEECKRLKSELDKSVLKNKLYGDSELKIADLARSIDCSSHALSYLFNQYLNCSYYDYINEFRVDEFKRMVNEEKFENYTLSAMAEMCGFSSRASFFRYFKKSTGITPNEYVRRLDKKNINDD